jgi:hypothetical protein
VFAIVHNQQETARLQRMGNAVHQVVSSGFVHSDRRSNQLYDQARIGDRRQLDEPHAVGILAEHRARQLDGQTCFATAAGADKREHPALTETLLERFQLAFAPDEAGERGRQVVARLTGAGAALGRPASPVSMHRRRTGV